MLIITLGDPYSINCEAIAQILPSIAAGPVVVVGSYWQWCWQTKAMGLFPPPLHLVSSLNAIPDKGRFFCDVGAGDDRMPAPSLSASARGTLVCKTLAALRSVRLTEGKLAVLTSPIHKKEAVAAGMQAAGQTEFFADLWRSQAIMILAGPRLRVGLATNHHAVRELPQLLTVELVQQKIQLMLLSLSAYFGCERPRLAVCGFNPHCGDGGIFGDEDERLIRPAVASFSGKQFGEVSGPFPADTVFYRALMGQFDGVLAMYHDQGLGPLKTVHFHDAINLSGGLPHLRVSPDHGPARDHFLQRTADLTSFRAAFAMVERYLSER